MTTAADAMKCPEVAHAGHRTVKRGIRGGVEGPQQRLACVASDGTCHYFAVPVDQDAKPIDRRRKHYQACPKLSHGDARVWFKGTRQSAKGMWERYLCVRPDGRSHYFRLLVAGDGSVLTSMEPPPGCPEHEQTRVTRNGSYGKGAVKRQRYRCEPGGGSPVHCFSPPLSRELVDAGTSACPTCDELLSPHRGALTGAWHTPWTLRGICQALSDLSLARATPACPSGCGRTATGRCRTWRPSTE